MSDLKTLVTALAADNNEKAEQVFHDILQAKMQELVKHPSAGVTVVDPELDAEVD